MEPAIQSSAYSPAQVTKYLQHLTLPTQYAAYTHSPQSFPKTIEALTELFRCQITRFPYDNLSVHYSATHLAVIDPASIYAKVMGPGDEPPSARGGYCLENSIFFHHMLRALGFEVYMTGVRNRERIDGIPQGEFKGWTHIVNIARLPTGTEYHVDVSFGGDGPTSPLPLISGPATQNLGAQEVRLIHYVMRKQSRPEQKVWIYQYRNGADKPWNSFYSFAELEFFQEDFEVMNRFTSWDALHKNNVWVVKFLRNGETNGLPLTDAEMKALTETQTRTDSVCVVGKIMLVNNVVKLNMGRRTRVIDAFETEERMEALRRWFSIVL